MAKVSLVKSNKNKDMLCVDGYFFYLERSTKKEYNWACSKRIQKKCCSRLVTTLIENVHTITKYSKDHSHEPFPDEVNVVKANNLVKKLAKSSLLTTSQIIQKSVVETVPVSRDYLPTKSVQKQNINTIKRAKVGLREPNSIEEIDIPLSFYVLENELFILSEKYFHNECMIICGTKSSLQLLDESDCWIMDGTFDVVPTFMRQLFSIHGRVEGQIIPLVFCIMSRKSLTSYETFFIELIELARGCGIQLNPKRILSDFEIGIISAAKKYFPDTRLQGCFFHFSQIIWRKIQKERYIV